MPNAKPVTIACVCVCPQVTPGVPGVKPVTIELTDFKTKKVVETLEVDACMVATGRYVCVCCVCVQRSKRTPLGHVDVQQTHSACVQGV